MRKQQRICFALAAGALVIGLSGLFAGCGAPFSPAAFVDGLTQSAKLDPPYTPSYFALQTSNPTWRTPKVSYHIGTGDKSVLRESINAEAKAWNGAGRNLFTLVEAPDSASANIVVNFLGQNQGVLFNDLNSNGIKLGYTHTDTLPNDTTVLTHADVYVDYNQDPATIDTSIRHELGHALGIVAHSDEKADEMYADLHVPPVITLRDWNTIRQKYDPRASGPSPAP